MSYCNEQVSANDKPVNANDTTSSMAPNTFGVTVNSMLEPANNEEFEEAKTLRTYEHIETDQMIDDDTESLKRSIYVGNVDYGVTPTELQAHFYRYGKLKRITIMVDRMTGCPKGYAYIEFDTVEAADNSLLATGSILRERPLKVMKKRRNIMGFSMSRGSRGARGRGSRRGFGPY